LPPAVKADAQTEAAVRGILVAFCCLFEARDAESVIRLFAPDSDIVMVTSEETLIRGHDELRTFLRRYVDGDTTYSWRWDREDVSVAGPIAWLLAEGTETAATAAGKATHAYRMTMVCEKRGDRWLLLQIHGSSPHE
jgi:uncharacterized protein (TIGR02246 family)